MKKGLILGVGNLILGDDGLGIHLVRLLKKTQSKVISEYFDFLESEDIGLTIIDLASGYETLIVIDSIQSTGDLLQGSIIDVKEENYKNLSGWGSHYIGFFEMRKLAIKSGITFPQEMHVLGIAVDDPSRISYELSREVRAILPMTIQKLEKKILELSPMVEA